MPARSQPPFVYNRYSSGAVVSHSSFMSLIVNDCEKAALVKARKMNANRYFNLNITFSEVGP